MILRFILLLAGLGIVYFVFTSNSGGPQSPLTGAPGESGSSCNMCHGSGNYVTMVNIDLLTQDSLVVNSYSSNQTYIVRLRVSGTNGPKGFGFQLVALDETTNSDMGLWSKLPANAREITMLSRKYLVHSSPSTSGLYYFHWTAPSTNQGNIKFYAAGLAANLNGSTNGDKHATLVKTVAFNSSTATEDTGMKVAKAIVFPNPATDFIQTDVPNAGAIRIFDLNGKLHLDTKSFSQGNKVDITMLPKGLYTVVVSDQQGKTLGKQLVYKG